MAAQDNAMDLLCDSMDFCYPDLPELQCNDEEDAHPLTAALPSTSVLLSGPTHAPPSAFSFDALPTGRSTVPPISAWREVVHPSTNQKYYHNTETNETSWTPPPASASNPSNPSLPSLPSLPIQPTLAAVPAHQRQPQQLFSPGPSTSTYNPQPPMFTRQPPQPRQHTTQQHP
jgi:hypothetical protein